MRSARPPNELDQLTTEALIKIDRRQPLGTARSRTPGITHPLASARVHALRDIEGVEVVAAADDDPTVPAWVRTTEFTS